VIVVEGIATLGSYPAFLTAVVLAGLMQIALGFLRAGVVGHGASVLIDGTRTQFIDHDIADAIDDFVASAPARGIAVDLRRSPTSLNELFKKDGL
jgi:MFS superfamily sulfate permease-like transporter